MHNRIIFILIFISLSISALSQGTKLISINIDNYNDTILILTSYHGDKIRLVDTAYSKEGKFKFSSNSEFEGGIYMAVNAKKIKVFEFIVNNESKPILSTDTSSYIRNMKIKGSKENKIFFDYIRFNENNFKQSKQLYSKLANTNSADEEYNKLISEIDSINKISKVYKAKIIESKHKLFVSALLNSMQDVEIPDSILSGNDSATIFKYYKNHYWDNLNLSDSRFLRTPILNKKVNEYFERIIPFQPDSIIIGIDFVLNKAIVSEENFSFLIWKFIAEYQNPKFMGFDKVFVHIAEKYFRNDDYQIENASVSVRKSIVERAERIKPLILGNKAPDLILIDTSNNYVSFNHLRNNYIILLFWDLECGICKKEIAYLKENMPKWKYDIGIFAINTNGDIEKWKKFIINNKLEWMNVNGTRSVSNDFHTLYDIYGTPVIYLLDKERNIVAKRMGAKQIPEIINRLEKNH